jgi:hypothetical protein
MDRPQFWLASFIPFVVLVATTVASGHWRLRWVTVLTAAALVASLPIGVVFVGLSLSIDLTPGSEHGPGTGIAFVPLVAVWGLCCLTAFARISLGLIARIWRAQTHRRTSIGSAFD